MNYQYKKKIVIILLLFILLIGLLLRLGVLREYIQKFTLNGDAKNYYIMSHQLVDRGIYGYGFSDRSRMSNAFVTPIYPLFLSAAYAVFHDPYRHITIVRLLQVIIGGIITPLFAFLFVRRILKRSDVALVTSFFMAIYPPYIKSSVVLLTEVVALSTMLLYFYFAAAGMQNRKVCMNILAGAAFAMHILTRPTMLPLFIIPFIYAFFIWPKEERKALVKVFFMTLAGFVVIMLPWWIRNYVVLHSLIITSTGSGNPLLAGSYPYMQNLFGDTTKEIMKGGQAQYAKERIIRGFSTQPMLYLKWYTIGKMQIMFQKPWLYYMKPLIQKYDMIFHQTLVWVGVAGIIANSVLSRVNRFINIYGMLFLGLYLVFIPVERYVYQYMFFLMLASAYLICFIVQKVNNLIMKKKLHPVTAIYKK